MKVAVLSECAMANTHGTGALLLRLFQNSGTPFVHLFLQTMGFGLSECPASHLLAHLPKQSSRSQFFAHRALRAVGLSLWRKDEINRRVFARFRRAKDITADVAYVVVSRESHARRFRSVLRELNCPYVVHVMDIYHETGLDPDTMPGFRSLFQGAHSNLALTDAIRNEIVKFDSRDVSIVPVWQMRNPYVPTPPGNQKPLVIVMIGRPYQQGMRLLEKAWPQLLDRFGPLELAYIGAHQSALPVSMRAYVRDYGYVTDQDEFSRLLSAAHLAFLSGPSELDCFGKFSFPSRCSDYLMAGLPVIACVVPGSATERFLQPLSPGCVRFAQSEVEIEQAVEGFTSSPEQWSRASEQARSYAREHLAIDTVREQILVELHGALQMSTARRTIEVYESLAA